MLELREPTCRPNAPWGIIALSSKRKGPVMGKFVIRETAAGFHFVLKAGNGEIIATSETYTTKDSCKKGIESVKKNAPDAPVVEED